MQQHDKDDCDDHAEAGPAEVFPRPYPLVLVVAPLLDTASDAAARECGPDACEQAAAFQIRRQADDQRHQKTRDDVFDRVFHNLEIFKDYPS